MVEAFLRSKDEIIKNQPDDNDVHQQADEHNTVENVFFLVGVAHGLDARGMVAVMSTQQGCAGGWE